MLHSIDETPRWAVMARLPGNAIALQRVDVPLSERGMRQAEHLARRMIDHGFVHIVRSNLRYDSGCALALRTRRARYWRISTMLDLTAGQVMAILVALAAATVFAVAWHVCRRN
jgi:hypothetical protein